MSAGDEDDSIGSPLTGELSSIRSSRVAAEGDASGSALMKLREFSCLSISVRKSVDDPEMFMVGCEMPLAFIISSSS